VLAEAVAACGEDSAEIQRHIDARTRRQHILTRDPDPCQLHAIIDENAIARITDPAIRGHQLARLAEAVACPNITVQILPVSAGVYPVTSEPFLHLAFPDDERDIIYIETAIDNRMLEEDDEIDRYKLKFAALQAAAITPDQTIAFLHQQAR
jgi:hypothetical protein